MQFNVVNTTILHLMGINRTRFSFKFHGFDQKHHRRRGDAPGEERAGVVSCGREQCCASLESIAE